MERSNFCWGVCWLAPDSKSCTISVMTYCNVSAVAPSFPMDKRVYIREQMKNRNQYVELLFHKENGQWQCKELLVIVTLIILVYVTNKLYKITILSWIDDICLPCLVRRWILFLSINIYIWAITIVFAKTTAATPFSHRC